MNCDPGVCAWSAKPQVTVPTPYFGAVQENLHRLAPRTKPISRAPVSVIRTAVDRG
jgi:hypothetical protein